MAQSTKDTHQAAMNTTEANEKRRQDYHDWLAKKTEFEAGNPSAEDRAKWNEENEAHECEACGGTGTVGGEPPKPLLAAGKEGIVERSARTHSEVEIPPVEKAGTKKDKTDTEEK